MAIGSPSGGREGDLVERADELAALASTLDRTLAGAGSAVHVVGEPGAGKTALARRAARLAESRGMRVLGTSAPQLESRSPYGVVRRLLERPVMALDPAARETLGEGPARLAVDFLVRRDTAGLTQADLLSSLVWLLEELATAQPSLVLVDDAHWADEESLLFLGSLRERLRDLPVHLVIATREVPAEERSAALAVLLADREATVLRPQALTAHGVATLLGRGRREPVDHAAATAAASVTGGNPFLVLALATLLESTPALTPDAVRGSVPTSVIDAVVARLAALDPAERALARAAAVLDSTSLRLAARLVDLDLAGATAAADRLRTAGLFAPGSRLEWRHALLRSAVYAAIAAGQRDELHRSAARLLISESLGHDPAARGASALLAAGHLTEAEGSGDPWAVETLRAAAAEALGSGAPQSAVRLLRRALAEPPTGQVLAPLLLELGLAELRAIDPGCVETLTTAVRLLEEPADLARGALALAEAFNVAGFHESAAEVLEGVLPRVAAAGSDVTLTVEAALVAASLVVPARIASARARLAAHANLAGATPAERLMVIQQMCNAVGTNQPAPVIRELARRALAESDSPERTDWVWARLFLGALGDIADVRRLTDDGFTLAAANGSVFGHVAASFVRGLAEFWAGSLVAAEAHFRAMLEHDPALGLGPLVSLLGSGGLAQTLALQGRVPEALALLEPFPEDLPPNAPFNGVAAMTFARAIVRQIAGDHVGALRAAEATGDLVRRLDVDSPTWAAWRALAIDPLRAVGRLDEARALAAEHLALCERSEVAPLLGEALRHCGQLHEDPAAGLELLGRSVAVLGDTDARLQLGLSHLALGAALRRAGRRSDARAELVAAQELAQACGAPGLAAHTSRELAACGGRVRRLELTGVDSLTASERRVAELAARGRRNAEIAGLLFVSSKTVETHLSRTYRKLGIAGREGLAEALAVERG